MQIDDNYDTIIVGAGQSGDPLARALASAGQKVALIERDAVGGTCINYGCTPTKTMVASGIVASFAQRSSVYGIKIDKFLVEMTRIRERKRAIVEGWRSSTESRLKAIDHLSLIYGEARFTGTNSLEVTLKEGGVRNFTAKIVVINAGCRPTIPNLPGIKDIPYLDSTSVMELAEVPEHLVILGGGYVACEFGQMFRRFGSRVTIIQRGPKLLGREDDDVADAVQSIFVEDGVDLVFNANTTSVHPTQMGIAATVNVNGVESIIEGSHLLVAIGRSPNTEALNLTKAGIETDNRGNIKVNDRLETNLPNVFAMGDIKGGPAFTHISYDDYRVLKRRLLDGDISASIAGRLVPYTVFIDPQLGRVGLSVAEVKELGRLAKVATLPMTSVARAVEMGETRGFMKAVVDADTGQIVGCAILGMDGGEIMAMLEIAMMGGVPYTALRDGIFSHPTLAESLNNLFATLTPI
jgi:pyruvate/2-oxoglutarate dehydrogenase complex dihydrolipoamide dehydrogenase (E3) component